MNKKGFVFIESVIVTVIIFIAAIPTYVLTKNVMNTFEKREKYDSSEHLYDLNSLKVFLYRNYNVNNLCNYIDDTDGTYNTNKETIMVLYQKDYVQADFLTDSNIRNTFISLLNNMGVKKLFFTKYNIDLNINIDGSITNKVNTDTKLLNYIKYLQKDITSETYLYRIIAEFDDGEFASINMYRLGK